MIPKTSPPFRIHPHNGQLQHRIMMAANHYSNSRQHPHLPSHLNHLPPLEPSADRHHGSYHYSNAGRRGSTDPILHASLAASASANAGGYGHHNGSAGSSLASPSLFDAPRRRSIQIEPTVPGGAHSASPFGARFTSQNNSPTPLVQSHSADTQSHDTPPRGQLNSNYQFGNYGPPPPSSFDEKPRIPHLTAPDGDGGGEPHSLSESRRGSASSHLLGVDKDNKPYSRSPELRVSHKLAERKRRKEMKELFDDLRDQLPVDKGPKTSKWEILSKAVEHIAQIEQDKVELSQEVERLRAQLGQNGHR